MIYIIGIDPGKFGGMAVASNEKIEDTFSLRDKPQLEIFQKIKEWKQKYDVSIAYVEDVHSMPFQSSQSTFSFGKELAKIETCLSICEISVRKVAPAKWQRSLGCLTKGNKKITHNKASKLFPYLKITHQIADACLIAFYGAKQHNPGSYSVDELMLKFSSSKMKR